MIHVQMVSDSVCPWCYIGHVRLMKAVEQTETEVDLSLRPFQLNPYFPTEGIARETYVQQKFGQQANEFYTQIEQVARAEGLAMRFDLITHQPSTETLHRLVYGLSEISNDLAIRFTLAIFDGFFMEGKRLDNTDYLFGYLEEPLVF